MKDVHAENLDAARRGWLYAFTNYAPSDARVIIPKSLWEEMQAMVRPFLPHRLETGGYCLMEVDDPDDPRTIRILRVFEYAGQTQRSILGLVPDGDEMHSRFTAESGHSPTCDRVAQWHSHPDHYGKPLLSIGDVEGLRESYNADTQQYWVMQLLVYANSRTGYCELGAFAITRDVVWKYGIDLVDSE